jgi:hypothetical protein
VEQEARKAEPSALKAAETLAPAGRDESSHEIAQAGQGKVYDNSSKPRAAEPGPVRAFFSRAWAQENQLLVRFKKTTVMNAGGFGIETSIPESEIAKFVQASGTKVLSHGPGRLYRLEKGDLFSTLSAAEMSSVLQGHPYVFYARPFQASAHYDQRMAVRFHETVVIRIKLGSSFARAGLPAMLKKHGLSMVKPLGEDAFLVGLPKAVPSRTAIEAMKSDGIFVESFVGEDEMAEVLSRRGLRVLQALGDRTFLVAVPADADAGEMLQALREETMLAETRRLPLAAPFGAVRNSIGWIAKNGGLIFLAALLAANRLYPPAAAPMGAAFISVIALDLLWKSGAEGVPLWVRAATGALSGLLLAVAGSLVFGLGASPFFLWIVAGGSAAGAMLVLKVRAEKALQREVEWAMLLKKR